MKGVLLPALQGNLGSWLYYATLMRIGDVAERISYASEIHRNTRLSEMIQRRLDDNKRAADIERYLLQTDDRFFNSLVVGVYGATPQWHPFQINVRTKAHDLANMVPEDQGIVGYLELTGNERLFALDGQHRLSGIRKAIEKNKDFAAERVSVLFVPHEISAAGLRRTRSLFVAINKKAVPVAKRDIIALDEIDLAAIITRRLVDEGRLFARGQVDLDRFTASIPAGAEALTTIGNFYDVVKLAIGEVIGNKKSAELVQASRIRLAETRIDHYAQATRKYLEALIALDPELDKAMRAKNFGPLIAAGRERDRSRVLFRPIGLTIFTKVIAHLCREHSLARALKIAKRIPLELSAQPFAGIIWDPVRNRMTTANANLCVSLLLYMLGEMPSDQRLRERYAFIKGVSPARVRLPSRFKK